MARDIGPPPGPSGTLHLYGSSHTCAIEQSPVSRKWHINLIKRGSKGRNLTPTPPPLKTMGFSPWVGIWHNSHSISNFDPHSMTLCIHVRM